MYKFFAFLDRMKYIKRWSLMRSVREENVMEHSQQVAMIAHALAVIGNEYYGKAYDERKVLLYALYHETGEVLTGDLPTPIKYFNTQINSAYKELERGAAEKLLTMLPDELGRAYREFVLPDAAEGESKLVKAADKLAAYIKCTEETKAGNAEFKKAKSSLWKTIKAYDMPEVSYFVENMLPAYELALDELD